MVFLSCVKKTRQIDELRKAMKTKKNKKPILSKPLKVNIENAGKIKLVKAVITNVMDAPKIIDSNCSRLSVSVDFFRVVKSFLMIRKAPSK